jgi:hypothetical protein
MNKELENQRRGKPVKDPCAVDSYLSPGAMRYAMRQKGFSKPIQDLAFDQLNLS